MAALDNDNEKIREIFKNLLTETHRKIEEINLKLHTLLYQIDEKWKYKQRLLNNEKEALYINFLTELSSYADSYSLIVGEAMRYDVERLREIKEKENSNEALKEEE